MKKIISIALVAVMCMMLCPVMALAESATMSVVADKTEAAIGEEVQLTVTAYTGSNTVGSLQFEVVLPEGLALVSGSSVVNEDLWVMAAFNEDYNWYTAFVGDAFVMDDTWEIVTLTCEVVGIGTQTVTLGDILLSDDDYIDLVVNVESATLSLVCAEHDYEETIDPDTGETIYVCSVCGKTVTDPAEEQNTNTADKSAEGTETTAGLEETAGEDGGDNEDDEGSSISGNTGFIMITAADNAYTIGSGTGVTVSCNGDIDNFVSVTMDGETVDASNYTLEGSTILTLSSDYLDTLSAGNHTIVITFSDGSVSTYLAINDGGSFGSSSGTDGSIYNAIRETTNITLWAVVLVVCAVGLCALVAVIVIRRKRMR